MTTEGASNARSLAPALSPCGGTGHGPRRVALSWVVGWRVRMSRKPSRVVALCFPAAQLRSAVVRGYLVGGSHVLGAKRMLLASRP